MWLLVIAVFLAMAMLLAVLHLGLTVRPKNLKWRIMHFGVAPLVWPSYLSELAEEEYSWRGIAAFGIWLLAVGYLARTITLLDEGFILMLTMLILLSLSWWCFACPLNQFLRHSKKP